MDDQAPTAIITERETTVSWRTARTPTTGDGAMRKAKQSDTARLVKQIGDALGERHSGPLTLIRRIVKQLGAETSLEYLQRTLEIEAQGGMQSAEGKRRTPGGIFFYLIKTERPKEETYPIFWLKPYTGQRASTKTTPPPTFTWQERDQVHTGERTTVNASITLRGQPMAESIQDTGTCIVCIMKNTKGPNIPKGVPAPPDEPTAYDVYISYKLWKRVAEAAKDAEDSLIIEGHPRIDHEHQSIAVIATGVSSRKLKATENTHKPS